MKSSYFSPFEPISSQFYIENLASIQFIPHVNSDQTIKQPVSTEYAKTPFIYSSLLDFEQNRTFAPKSMESESEDINDQDPTFIKQKRPSTGKRRRRRGGKKRKQKLQMAQLLAAKNYDTEDELEEGEIRPSEIYREILEQEKNDSQISTVEMITTSTSANSNIIFDSQTFEESLMHQTKKIKTDVEIELKQETNLETNVSTFTERLLNQNISRELNISNQSNEVPVINQNKCPITISSNPDLIKFETPANEEKRKSDEIRENMEMELDLIYGEANSRNESKSKGRQTVKVKPRCQSSNKVINLIEESIETSQIPSKSSIPLLQSRCYNDPRKKLFDSITQSEKLNLVLDLDETLLNSHTFPVNFNISSTINHISSDHVKIITTEEFKIVIVFHPYVSEFLKRMSKFYNIYIYSHGRHEYVQNILDMLDRGKQFINRDVMFKNFGQVSKTTPKLLSSLGLTPEEIKRTLILDDQKQIWEQDHQRVICTKKFIPLKHFIKEDKYSRYLLFMNEEDTNRARWLVHEENKSELNYYSETDVLATKTYQLEALASFLERLAHEYYLQNNSCGVGIEELYSKKFKSILKNLKIAILSDSDKRIKMFEELAAILGAVPESPEKAHYLLLDETLDENQEILLQRVVNKNPLITVLSVFWLIECFFNLNKVLISKFLIKPCGKFIKS